MKDKTIHKCIWCGKTEPEVSFNTIAHVLPKRLGGVEIVNDVCDECNHYFGTAPKGKHGVPCMDHVFKEIFGVFRLRCSKLNAESYKNFKSTYFSYYHKQNLIKVRKTFNSKIITRQFKRSLYEVFLQKYHRFTGDGHNPMFQMVRDFARYDKGNPHVYYAFNNIIIGQSGDYEQHPYLLMNYKLNDDINKYGFFNFWMLGQNFYLEVLPNLANIYTDRYLQEKANNTLIMIRNNECIYEFDDIMQIDFLMQRFI